MNKNAGPGRKLALVLLAGSLAGAICAGTAVAAAPDSDAPSVTIRYADLDLTSEAGTRALYHRLLVAAKEVCPDPSTRDLATLHFIEGCRQQAIVNAARQIPSPQLAAMVAHTAKAG
ncbi:MAG: UrcA family protein [Steroidobacteraceae bacterium]|jgi:UrcA family protein